MGYTKKIRLIIRKSNNKEFLGEWRSKTTYNQFNGYGFPTTENLGKWRDKFNQSLMKGECNEHLGINYLLQCKLEVYNQFTGEVVCIYNAPMFEIIPS